jgi:AraC family transcriptional regulator of adaptative response/methylated-DNA-[protein]-cysteine methyltransferase
MFLLHVGLTPAKYGRARREEKLRRLLGEGAQVTQAATEVGWQTGGRFHEAARAALGMSASRYRASGREMTVAFAVGQCSLGAILVAATDLGVCAVSLGDDPQALVEGLQDRFFEAELSAGDPHFEGLVARVVQAIEGSEACPDLPLDLRGTTFQIRVWQALREIPRGETLTYSGLATRLGHPSAARAVASAVAKNPVAVAVPCHRIIRADGGLGGYRWGIDRKQALLLSEGCAR